MVFSGETIPRLVKLGWKCGVNQRSWVFVVGVVALGGYDKDYQVVGVLLRLSPGCGCKWLSVIFVSLWLFLRSVVC